MLSICLMLYYKWIYLCTLLSDDSGLLEGQDNPGSQDDGGPVRTGLERGNRQGREHCCLGLRVGPEME